MFWERSTIPNLALDCESGSGSGSYLTLLVEIGSMLRGLDIGQACPSTPPPVISFDSSPFSPCRGLLDIIS